MADVISLPTARARRAYEELRKMGFGAAYSRSVVDVLEGARSNIERWAAVEQHVVGGRGTARGWLVERGYMP